VEASENCEFAVKVSFLEIYMERIQDLIDSSKSNLQVKEEKSKGIYVQDATEVYVSSPLEMMQVMTAGSRNRSIAATRMNAKSSRSHSIFVVTVDQRDVDTGARKTGRLYFVDLAGSEKIGKTHVTGKQLEEAKMINKSLSALGNVINALTDKPGSFIPYRDSKLTRMLQESLGGNSQTTLVIACSMSSYNDRETLSTLRFGLRAKKIQNKPIVNQEKSAKELQKQLGQAQQELQKQAQIICKIKAHIQQHYSQNPTLVREVAGIIDQSLVVAELNEQTEAEATDHSVTLLKQHVEIVNLNEEMQRIKLEKKEVEDELAFRNKGETELQGKVEELEERLQEERELHQKRIEELDMSLGKAESDSQRRNLDLRRLRKACERLRSDLVFHKPREGQLFSHSLNELMEAMIESDFLDDAESSHRPHKSLPDLRTVITEDTDISAVEERSREGLDEASAQVMQELREVIEEQRRSIETLSKLNVEMKASFDNARRQLSDETAKCSRIENLLGLKDEEIFELDSQRQTLQRQLELKVKNIEVERASVQAELQQRDDHIISLKVELARERERLDNLLGTDDSKQVLVQQESCIEELVAERKHLLEELLRLRKTVDSNDEQLANVMQRNHRLERMLALQKSSESTIRQRALSPKPAAPVADSYQRKVVKPIRGGGGDIWNFQNKNRDFAKAEKVPTKKAVDLKGSGNFQDMFRGLLGNFLG
jgi:kinesin family protein 5